MKYPCKIDLHIHTTVSDGTDRPEEIINCVRKMDIALFSISDHDAIKGCGIVQHCLQEGDPQFITGVEFSCKDEEGQYHILGYHYDPDAAAIREVVDTGHALRMNKLRRRLDFLEHEFGFTFSEEDREVLFALDNPGKPHLGNLMVRYGYAPSKEIAINQFINQLHSSSEYIRPEEAIRAILASDGIPVLAHPSYGRGDDIIVGDDMDRRLKKLIGFGLQGVEAFYSGFSPRLQNEMLALADQYGLYVTAGSDYHGRNKLVHLGETNLDTVREYPEGLCRFLHEVQAEEQE